MPLRRAGTHLTGTELAAWVLPSGQGSVKSPAPRALPSYEPGHWGDRATAAMRGADHLPCASVRSRHPASCRKDGYILSCRQRKRHRIARDRSTRSAPPVLVHWPRGFGVWPSSSWSCTSQEAAKTFKMSAANPIANNVRKIASCSVSRKTILPSRRPASLNVSSERKTHCRRPQAYLRHLRFEAICRNRELSPVLSGQGPGQPQAG